VKVLAIEPPSLGVAGVNGRRALAVGVAEAARIDHLASAAEDDRATEAGAGDDRLDAGIVGERSRRRSRYVDETSIAPGEAESASLSSTGADVGGLEDERVDGSEALDHACSTAW
jgi:hypothetical protein